MLRIRPTHIFRLPLWCKIIALLGCYTVQIGCYLSIYWSHLQQSSSPRRTLLGCLTLEDVQLMSQTLQMQHT